MYDAVSHFGPVAGITQRGYNTVAVDVTGEAPKARKRAAPPRRRELNTIQDLYLDEFLLAVRLAESAASVEQVAAALAEQLPQNSPKTRAMYARRIMTLLLPGGRLEQPILAVWRAYHDAGLLRDQFRVRYLEAVKPLRAFLLGPLSHLTVGDAVPEALAAEFVEHLSGRLVPKTAERLPRNLAKLGFLSRADKHYIRAVPKYEPTSVLLELHRHFGQQPATVPFSEVARDPFWRFVGVPDEGTLRDILYRAVQQGMLAKFVKSDELYQITMAYSYAELLEARRCLS